MTPAQNSILKAYIAADPVLSVQTSDGDGLGFIANALNALASPNYSVWRSSTSGAAIQNCIIWANLTPIDTADGTALFTNRALVCQAKQINLQIMIQGKESISSNQPLLRNGLQDALTNIPSGVSGATLGGGWVATKTAMTRLTTVAEKILTTGAGTTAAPSDLVFEGLVSTNDVDTARRS